MAGPSNADQMFAKLAIKNGLLTQDQAREALGTVKSGGGDSLGAVALANGWISDKHVDAIQKKVASLGGGGGGGAAEAVGTGAEIAAIAEEDWSSLHGGTIDAYLKKAREIGASDFHYQTDSPPAIRMHGQLVKLKHPVLTAENVDRALREMLSDAEYKRLAEHNDLNITYEADHGRYRTSLLRQRKGFDAIFRVIDDRVPTLEELGLPAVLKEFTKYRQGLLLITGPGGSGKSSTMAALCELVNQTRHDHVITVEDPIEFVFESKSCNVNQRHVSVHTESFATALRSAMRADPDVIMVGEMRDLETISMAITAAETGHLVMGTLHTTNAIRSVDRIIDAFPPKEQEQIRAMVSESLRGVISQQLIPRKDGKGRVPALEILFSTSAVANLIREGQTFKMHSVLQTGKAQGMAIMDDSIRELLNKGLITKEQAIYRAEEPSRFRD